MPTFDLIFCNVIYSQTYLFSEPGREAKLVPLGLPLLLLCILTGVPLQQGGQEVLLHFWLSWDVRHMAVVVPPHLWKEEERGRGQTGQ